MCLRELGLDRRAFGTHFLGSWRQDRADFLRELGELLAPREASPGTSRSVCGPHLYVRAAARPAA